MSTFYSKDSFPLLTLTGALVSIQAIYAHFEQDYWLIYSPWNPFSAKIYNHEWYGLYVWLAVLSTLFWAVRFSKIEFPTLVRLTKFHAFYWGVIPFLIAVATGVFEDVDSMSLSTLYLILIMVGGDRALIV